MNERSGLCLIALAAVAGCAHGDLSQSPYHAAYMERAVLTLYSGSEAGLVTSGLPVGHNPGDMQPMGLPGLVFVDNPGSAGTYLWRFDDGVKLLDRNCAVLSRADALALAGLAGEKSVVVYVYAGTDKKAVAPAKVEVFARSGGDPQDCSAPEPGAAVLPK